MDIFDSHGNKWRQNQDGSWWRWDGSRWNPPDATYQPPVPAPLAAAGRDDSRDYSDSQGSRWTVDAKGQHWRWSGSGWIASAASPDYRDPTAPATPAKAPPTSYDPPAGGPTYTPGIVFGQGALPGQGQGGQPYQRQWFDVGPNADSEGLNVAYYNDPGNWQYAWDKVVNQFGGTPGGDFSQWLQGFGSKARADFQNTVPYAGGNLDVANFLDAYAPQLKGVYGLLPSSQAHGGGKQAIAGRATY